MSLTTSITDLTAQVTQLIQTVDQQDDVVRAKIAELAAMVPDTRRVFYVDAQIGDNANDGRNASAPLATLEEAFNRAVAGGYNEIRLLTDVGWNDVGNIPYGLVYITGWDPAVNSAIERSVTYASTAASDPARIAYMYHHGGLLWWSRIHHRLPERGDITRPDHRSSLVCLRSSAVAYHQCTVSAAGTGGANPTHLVHVPYMPSSIGFFNCAFGANVALGNGRIIANVAAAADPNSQWNITTNITQN